MTERKCRRGGGRELAGERDHGWEGEGETANEGWMGKGRWVGRERGERE